MAESIYYDGAKLLSLSDIDGNKPEIYMVVGNRSSGKTTYFSRMIVNRFKKKGEKFVVLYRYRDDLSDCAGKFFNDIQGLFFPNDEMTAVPKAKGAYTELLLNGNTCGYCIAINMAEKMKRYSHFFNEVTSIMFDEFQSESNKYCPKELNKFQSLHRTIARGKGKMTRYVPVYMISNSVTLLNPYFSEFDISSRLNSDTKYLRGHGWVLEQNYNDMASKTFMESGFARAFAGSQYTEYASQNVYLNDSRTFIECPSGKNNYLATLKYNGKNFAIREYAEQGILYCDLSADMTYPFKIVVSTEDHDVNYVMLKNHDMFLSTLRFFFDNGCFRFKDLRCKEAVLKALSY